MQALARDKTGHAPSSRENSGIGMAISNADFQFVRSFLATRAGVNISDQGSYFVEARLLPLARDKKVDGPGALIQKLQSEENPELEEEVVDALLPKQTGFFLDTHPFELLRKKIIPFLEMRRDAARQIRILSAGCATGQEAFSIAMVLRWFFSHLADWDLRIEAMDFSKTALMKADEGRYNQIELNRGLPSRYAKQCFLQEGNGFVLKKEIRALVRFYQWNLIGQWPPLGECDVIFLRNVLCHLVPDAKREVLAKIGCALKPDGFLVLGSAETTINLDATFAPVFTENTAYFQLST
jgi:chemotaxis protein methyltransferase CheR